MSGSVLMVDIPERERCNNFVTRECMILDGFSSPVISGPLRAYARCADIESVAKEVARMRHKVVVGKFNNNYQCHQLSEMLYLDQLKARDPLDYLNDVLRWVKEAISSEDVIVCELLTPDLGVYTGLVKIQYDETRSAYLENAERVHTFVMNKIFEIFCKPLKVIIQGILHFHPNSLTTVYKLSIRLDSYIHYVPYMLSEEFTLGNMLRMLHDSARKTFLYLLGRHRQNLFEICPTVSTDLCPPPEALEGVSVLLEMIKIHDKRGFYEEMLPYDLVKSNLLDPIIRMIRQAMVAYKSCEAFCISSNDPGSFDTVSTDEPMSVVFLRNCMDAISKPLLEQGGDYSKKLVMELRKVTLSHMDTLPEDSVNAILETCCLFHSLKFELPSGLESFDRLSSPKETGDAFASADVGTSSHKTFDDFPAVDARSLSQGRKHVRSSSEPVGVRSLSPGRTQVRNYSWSLRHRDL